MDAASPGSSRPGSSTSSMASSRPASSKSTASSRPGSSRPGSSRPGSSRPGSSRPSSTGSRPRTGKGSRPPTAASVNRGAASAGNIVRSLSATSNRSVAWSDEVEQKEQQKEAEAEEEPAAKPAPTGPPLSKELEEELNRDESANKDEGAVGCWMQFTTFISSLWDTTDMAQGEDRESLVRTTLREFVIYMVFLCILSVVTISAMSPTMFRYTQMIRSVFAEADNVKQIPDFWKFMENDFVNGVYSEEWYNKGDQTTEFPCPGNPNATGPCPIPHRERMILYANRLLGVPRIRQLRVQNSSCLIPPEFENSITVCYNAYSEEIEDVADFGPGYRKYTQADAWRYQNVKELGAVPWRGVLASYSGAGSVQNFREVKNETVAIIRELKEGLWIGRGTRYVGIDFTVYNANINLFCVVKISFEFPPTGGIMPEPRFNTVKLLRYITPSEYALAGAEIVFAIFIIYFLIEELIEIKIMRLEYFYSFWNWIDMFVIIVSVSTLSFNVFLVIEVSLVLKSLLAEPEKFADFTYLEQTSKSFQDLAAMTVFFGYIKIFKYISFNKTMAQLSGTIQRCAGDVVAFSVMFFIVFFAYAQLGYLMFGIAIRDFSTFTDACFTQFRLILGDFNFPAMEAADRFWGPVYFISYVFFVFFVLMNMFLAIINDTYSEVKEEVDNRREEFQVGDMVWRGYNNMREVFHERDKLIDIQGTVKLAADDGVVTYDEIREALRKLNFSELEIEVFCAKYDKDGDYEFALEEINAIEGGLGDQFENYDHLVLESEKKVEEDPERKMTKFEFTKVSTRVNLMEEQMSTVIDKVDAALRQMEMIEERKGGDDDQPGSRAGSAKSTRSGSAKSRTGSASSRAASARSTASSRAASAKSSRAASAKSSRAASAASSRAASAKSSRAASARSNASAADSD